MLEDVGDEGQVRGRVHLGDHDGLKARLLAEGLQVLQGVGRRDCVDSGGDLAYAFWAGRW